MDWEKIVTSLLPPALGVVAAWAVMQSQVSDLRDTSKVHSKKLEDHGLQLQQLETQHEGASKQLADALSKLEHVTEKLQSIALDIARNSPQRN